MNPTGLLAPPDYLLAYDWVVSSKTTAWSKHIIIQNPKAAETITSTQLEAFGDYDVRMRVFFTDNRYVEKKVVFSVQDKFLVGIGDSFAAGEGNPDAEAETSALGTQVCRRTTASMAADLSPGLDREPVWVEPKAHRSNNSAHARAAMSFQHVFEETWNLQEGPRATNFSFTKITWASFARTGAAISAGLLQPQEGRVATPRRRKR